MNRSLIVLFFVFGCSKKQETPPPPPPVPPTASVASSAEPPRVEPAKPAPPPPQDNDDAVETDFTLREELALNEGKQVPLGKMTPADKDRIKAHAAAIQTAWEEIVKDGYRQVHRFNASWLPATFIIFEKPAKNDAPAHKKMLEVEGEATNTVDLALDDPNYDLWSTPRGYFIEITGDERLTLFMRAADSKKTMCRGKAWTPTSGEVQTIEHIPTYVTRGRDVNEDGKNEFPESIFGYELKGFVQSITPPADTLCNYTLSDALTIDVVGVDREGAYRGYYERRLKSARARGAKLRKLADDPKAQRRKKGNLRMTNACALDVAQAALETFAYERILGADGDKAIGAVDELMKGLSLKPEACEGLVSRDGDGTVDQWPDVRAALLAWTPPKITD